MPKCPNCHHTLEKTVFTKIGKGSVMTFQHTANCSGCAHDWDKVQNQKNVTYHDKSKFKR